MSKIRVLLADDHTIVAEGLRSLLEGEFEFVGTVGDGRALLDAAQELNPDVIVADISMPVLSGLDAARQLKQDGSTAKIIFLTMHTRRNSQPRRFAPALPATSSSPPPVKNSSPPFMKWSRAAPMSRR